MINFRDTLLLGHRGARGEALENTFSGFQYAQNLKSKGLSGVEFDIQLNTDGHLLVFHDDDLQRMCGRQSRVDQLTLTEIQCQRQFGQPIMTLASIAPALSGFDVIELEIKTHNRTNYAVLVEALDRALINTSLASLPMVLTSFDVALHHRLQRHKRLSHMPRGLLIRTPEALASATNTALQLGCIQLGVHYPLLTQSIIKHSHRYGLPVSAWTVNDMSAIEQLIKWETDVIITDFPSYCLLP
ncbi:MULTISPECIES: glycerophosphodiester phosphodiesterase [unclassified Psychrobacter]|uniref:glycerophosphodiester phosphodiesterase n=1 Tax=unclassified Psychrobacter TaxID=196806 RepID=UPI0025B4CA7E|nr:MULTISPECIES: glycerophosphodiester phosphodiesterase [unclassified Psychrobacter]MDN3502799.1 glycerophosphodiester phosphodiesterase [Psychrobacter sp. 5A.1]